MNETCFLLPIMNKKEKLILEKLEPYHKSKFNLEISISRIESSGFGVFTNDFIPRDSLIDMYYGREIKGLYGGDYYFKIDEMIGIDALDSPRCYMAFLNDSNYRPVSKRGLKKFKEHYFTNNCRFQVDKINKTVSVYSIIDINPGEELFISYGYEYW